MRADEEKVLLEKEIEYLHSYIDLQQQRFGKNVQVNGELQAADDNYEIEPMLLIPLLKTLLNMEPACMKMHMITAQLKTEKGTINSICMCRII